MTDLERAVRRYLGAKRVTLWSDFDLTHADSFEAAVAWLMRQVADVNKLMPHDYTPPSLRTPAHLGFNAVPFDPERVDL